MRKTIAFVVLASLGVLTPAIHAEALVIDHFTQSGAGQAISVTGLGSVTETVTGLTEVLGGARTIQLAVSTSSYGLSSSVNVSPAGTGTLSLGNDSGQDGVGTITWDAAGAGLGGVDLTNGGTLPYLQSKIVASDLNLGFTVEITETATAGGSMAVWSTSLGYGVSYVNQPLASFINAANVDFNQVDKVALILSGPLAQDATLDLLEFTNTPAPEPVTMSLLGLGGLAILLRRKQSLKLN